VGGLVWGEGLGLMRGGELLEWKGEGRGGW
jgi:hypothetical protein